MEKAKVLLRLEPKVKDKAVRLAKKRKWSLNTYIESAVEEAIKNESK